MKAAVLLAALSVLGRPAAGSPLRAPNDSPLLVLKDPMTFDEAALAAVADAYRTPDPAHELAAELARGGLPQAITTELDALPGFAGASGLAAALVPPPHPLRVRIGVREAVEPTGVCDLLALIAGLTAAAMFALHRIPAIFEKKAAQKVRALYRPRYRRIRIDQRKMAFD